MSYDIGEKPGKGTYMDALGHTVTLNDSDDVLLLADRSPPAARRPSRTG